MKNKFVISFLGEKGGTGKTTLATNVASCFHNIGYKILLADSDKQASARDWKEASGEGETCYSFPVIGVDRETIANDIKAICKPFDIIIIDGAPNLSKTSIEALKISDLVLIPVQPSPYDIWACAGLVELIKTRQAIDNGKLSAAFIMSRVIKNTILSREVVEALAEYNLPTLINYTSQLQSYPLLASEGLSVFEFSSNRHHPGKARNEVHDITTEILGIMNEKKFVKSQD